MSDVITSLQNQRVKDAVKLRDRRGREKQRRIIIDGVREIGRAVGAGLLWSDVFVCEQLIADEHRRLVDDLRQAGALIQHVDRHVFEKIAFGDRAEGIVAVAQTPTRSLPSIELPAAPTVAVLEAIEKPGNVGAILRTADAAGISAVILADGGTDLFNPSTIRASGAAVFSLPSAATSSEQARRWLREREVPIVSARVDGTVDYADADLRPPAAIVLGSEAAGLSEVWRGDEVVSVRLPMLGAVDSLNVSVTAGILFYETLRQRGAER